MRKVSKAEFEVIKELVFEINETTIVRAQLTRLNARRIGELAARVSALESYFKDYK